MSIHRDQRSTQRAGRKKGFSAQVSFKHVESIVPTDVCRFNIGMLELSSLFIRYVGILHCWEFLFAEVQNPRENND